MEKGAYIIAEAGVNHNGSLDLAYKLIDAAVDAGANAIKFQTFKTENLVTADAKKAIYQQKNTDAAENQFEMLKRLELSKDDHWELMNYCVEKNIDFLSTPFDMESARFLINDLKLDTLKISSGEITNAPLLLMIARAQKKIILSTGMSSIEEIKTALSILAFGYMNLEDHPSYELILEAYESVRGKELLKDNVIILHCTTEYPTPLEEVNLLAIDYIKNYFNLETGLSDHSEGIFVPIAAVSRGSKVIEKHFTLDRNLPGPDHKASLEPEELKEMISAIRQIEKALGVYEKKVTKSESKNKEIARKSLVAAEKIKKGEVFTSENLTVKRPGTGINPIFYWNWLGKEAARDYEKDEVLKDE